MLPSLDGFEVCREIRKFSRVPVVMLTARTDLIDVVVGLESGADDYVKKPFELPELIARLRAVLRRAAAPAEATPIRGARARDRPGRLSPCARTASRSRSPRPSSGCWSSSPKRPGQVFTRELLLQRVWDYEYLGESHLVDVAIGAAAGQGGGRSVASGADQDGPRRRLPPGPGLKAWPGSRTGLAADAADADGSGRADCGGGWSSPSCW